MTRRLFGTLCGLVFFVNFGRVAFAPLVDPLQAAFGVGPAAIGTVTTLVWVGSAVPRLPAGYLLTRVRRERVVLATGGLLAVAAAATGAADSLLTLRIGGFVIGLASGVYFVAAIPLVGELLPGQRGRAVGIHGTASQLAAVLAPGLVLVFLATLSWRYTFWFLAVAAGLSTLTLVHLVRRHPESVPTPPAGERKFTAALGHWRVIVAGTAFVAGAGLVWQGVFNFYVPYLTQAKGLTLSTANSLLTLVFTAGVPAFWLSGRLADRLRHVPYLLGINAGFLLALIALLLADSLVAIAIATALLGLVIHGLFPAIDTYMLGTLPAADRTSAYAVFSGVALLLESMGSGIVGSLRGAGYAFDTVFSVAAAGLAALILVLLAVWVIGVVPTGSPAPTN
ncbi:MAG: MFS transporter [Halolamina sp.]|uniref:MFS transporter n=1 Tax=Halolamina sp. TaxID=1940283 RepID=UPI002FC37BB5